MKNLFLTLKASLRDDAGHTMTKTIMANFPVLQLGEDSWPPTEVTIEPSNPRVSSGTTLTFLARAKDESTIVSYQWFVNGRPQGCAGSTPTFTYTFTEAGTYTVMVKVCDRTGNCSFGLATVTVTAA